MTDYNFASGSHLHQKLNQVILSSTRAIDIADRDLQRTNPLEPALQLRLDLACYKLTQVLVAIWIEPFNDEMHVYSFRVLITVTELMRRAHPRH